MRRPAPEAPRALAALAVALGWLACGPPPAPEPPVAPPPPPPSASAPPAAHGARRTGRTLLAEPRETPLPFVLQAQAGGRAVLAVAQRPDDRASWVRRLDERGAGPLLRFVDTRVFASFDRADGSTLFVTSDGTRVCVGPAAGGEPTCVQSNPAAAVPVGDRLALLELTTQRPPAAHGGARQRQGASPPDTPREGARTGDKGVPGARPASPAPRPRETKAAPHKAGKGKGEAGAAKKKPAHAAPARRPSHPLVELFIRWVDPSGALGGESPPGGRRGAEPAVIDAEPHPTGLHFEAPIDGMTLVDARPRPPGIDVLWYETAPGRRARSALGSGRLMAASLRADGTLDFQSRVAVLDADLEYGQLKDHRAPRLVGNDSASVYLGLDAKGQCEAVRVRPSLAHLTPPSAVCAVAPDRLAGPLDANEPAALERILADEPRRAFGQPKGDLGLVAWAGDRGYYLHGSTLRSAARSDGAARDEPPPFPARRASIAWGSLASDGEGIAFAEGIVHVGGAAAAPGAAPVVERGPTPSPGILAAPEIADGRRHAVRIGATWWTARGPRLRLWPEASAAASQPSHPDTTVLTGGSERGLSLEVASGALHLTAVDATGSTASLGVIAPAPVLAGFDACERAAGGVLLAGTSPRRPDSIVVLAIDASGKPGDLRAIPSTFPARRLAVRLIPLPAGGALLLDPDRRHVAWLDDDARVLADAPWPAAASAAVCPHGRPMPLSAPAPTPGQFVTLPGVTEGACIVGDPAWTRDGSLRWFGGTSEALDFTPELAVLPLLPAPAPAPAPAPPPPPALAPPLAPPPVRFCPPEMVSIAGRFCVDRFEAMLVDARSGAPLSPDYPTTPGLLDFILAEWSTGRERAGNVHARAFPLPWISPARAGDKPEPLAVSRLGARPSGYVTGIVAEAACTAAGKRLCTLDEFVTACRGQDDTLFPYGDTYEDGTCNVFREEHPAALLHGNASIGHLDPRLNRVLSRGRPLLQHTGESPRCRSRWGDDAVYDSVGNLDEWVDEGKGAFAGGFYARSTRSGCEAVVTAHPRSYADYSTGVRCCRDRM